MITDEVYRGLANMPGWWAADHIMNRELWSDNTVPRYVYNKIDSKTAYKPMHGHTHDVCDNGIDEAFKRFCFPKDSTFKFISEVVSV